MCIVSKAGSMYALCPFKSGLMNKHIVKHIVTMITESHISVKTRGKTINQFGFLNLTIFFQNSLSLSHNATRGRRGDNRVLSGPISKAQRRPNTDSRQELRVA